MSGRIVEAVRALAELYDVHGWPKESKALVERAEVT
jgi:hypothetical protein